MTKRGLQGVATGLLLATAIFAYLYFFQVGDEEERQQNEEIPQLSLSSEEMKTLLEKQGFVILAEEEYDLLLRAKDTENEQEDETVVAEEETIHYSIVTIERGMSGTAVAKKLEQHKIIEDYQSFVDYIIENEVSHKIEIGTYELHSGMDFEEIVTMITKK